MDENMLPPNAAEEQARAAGLEARAQPCDRAAAELERALQHLQTAARHFREGEVPRGCAHVFAAYGHQHNALTAIDDLAVFHATHSIP